MSRTVHMCIDIRGVMRWPKRQLVGMFLRENGTKMSADEVWSVLADHLGAGRKVLPMGKCEGFSFETGCPGHEEGAGS